MHSTRWTVGHDDSLRRNVTSVSTVVSFAAGSSRSRSPSWSLPCTRPCHSLALRIWTKESLLRAIDHKVGRSRRECRSEACRVHRQMIRLVHASSLWRRLTPDHLVTTSTAPTEFNHFIADRIQQEAAALSARWFERLKQLL